MLLAFVAFWRRCNFSFYAASNKHVTRTPVRSFSCYSVLLFIFCLINDAYFEISFIAIWGISLGRFKSGACRTFPPSIFKFPFKDMSWFPRKQQFILLAEQDWSRALLSD